MTGVSPGPELRLRLALVGHDGLGRFHEWWRGERTARLRAMAVARARAGGGADAAGPRRRRAARDARGRCRPRAAPQLHELRGGGGRLAARRDARGGRPQAASAARGSRPCERGALERAALDGHGRPQAERRRRRLLRVPAGVARGPARRGGAGRELRGGARGQAALRQGPHGQGPRAGRLHARGRHARPGAEPERLPDDRRRDRTRARCGSS